MAELALIPPDISMALAHDGLRFASASAPVLIDSATGNDVRRALIADYYTHVLQASKFTTMARKNCSFPFSSSGSPRSEKRLISERNSIMRSCRIWRPLRRQSQTGMPRAMSRV
jgi:hypothetical protein